MASFPRMRTGFGVIERTPEGTTIEDVLLKLIVEVYKLADKHRHLSGRYYVQREDVVRALKVSILPSYEFIQTLEVPSRSQNHDLTTGADDSDIAKTADALHFAGCMLGTGINILPQLMSESVSSSFSAATAENEEDGSSMATASVESEEDSDAEEPQALEPFCFCSDEIQMAENDMYLMWRAPGLWREYMEEKPEGYNHPMARIIRNAIVKVDAELAGDPGSPAF